MITLSIALLLIHPVSGVDLILWHAGRNVAQLLRNAGILGRVHRVGRSSYDSSYENFKVWISNC